jgi:hypothetical protein
VELGDLEKQRAEAASTAGEAQSSETALTSKLEGLELRRKAEEANRDKFTSMATNETKRAKAVEATATRTKEELEKQITEIDEL